MHQNITAGLSLLLAPVVGACFTADFDSGADGAFFCQADADCQEGQVCSVLDRCLNDVGPSLAIRWPEPLQLIADVGEVRVPITVVGADLVLVDKGGAEVEGEGYVELRLNGVLLETLSAGDIATGLTHESAPGAVEEAGIHRLWAQAFRADGTPYTNPSASAKNALLAQR